MFYKCLDGNLLVEPHVVVSPEYVLSSSDILNIQFPVDGWYWFDTASEMQSVFVFDGMGWQPPSHPTQSIVADNRVQHALNKFAKQGGFDSIEDACTYVYSNIPEWKEQALHAIAVRDTAWTEFYKTGTLINMTW